MKRSTILCSLLPVLLVLSLCACSASPSGASDSAETPNNIFHELTLPAVTEGQVSVLDARGSRILYVREEKLLSKDGGYAYYETKQVGIYDVDAQKSLAVWEPETPGNYFGGALLGWRCRHSRPPARLHQRLPRTVCGHVLRRFAAQPRRIHR